MWKYYVKSQDVWASTEKSIKKVCNEIIADEPLHSGFTSGDGIDQMPINMIILWLPNTDAFLLRANRTHSMQLLL